MIWILKVDLEGFAGGFCLCCLTVVALEGFEAVRLGEL